MIDHSQYVDQMMNIRPVRKTGTLRKHQMHWHRSADTPAQQYCATAVTSLSVGCATLFVPAGASAALLATLNRICA